MAKDSSSTAAPKKPGRIAQLRTVLQQSKALDPKIVWWMAGAFVLTLAVIVGIGWLVNWPVYAAILGLPLAALAATIVMSRRAEGAAYAKLEGQPGAAGAALSSLRGGWFTSSEPVAVEGARSGSMADAALVYRAVGRPGVVLVAEGPEARAQRLLLAEKKRTERVAPGVPVTVYRVGSGKEEGVVEIRKLTSKVQRMRATLSKDDVLKVNQRLRALGGVKLPVPQGIDPARARPDRKGMR
ncbi:MAG TPA: DUF4191 domain-containing protein, partial [Dermatophilaceae bacterium]|nr:DUF4191 domain-containing protein [Dermatophilaceae bacterium]